MRIIGGARRGKKLSTPPDATVTRPIPDIVKEALFNLLRGHCEGATVLDCFSGTGSIGLEAVSRGAARAVCVERDRKIAAILKRNVDALGFGDRVTVLVADALAAGTLAKAPRELDLIFFDPPYPIVREPESWDRVRRQFARAVARLRPTGFATIRTPHPFVFVPGEDSLDEPSKNDRGGKGKDNRRKNRRDWDEDTARPPRRPAPKSAPEPESITIDLDAISDEELDRLDAELAGGAPPPAKPKPLDGDLTIDGAEGPETHAYGTTALHLYMRERKDEAQPADTESADAASAVDDE